MTINEFYSNFDKLSKILQDLACSLTKNMEDARDLYQETAYRAFKNRQDAGNDKNFQTWSTNIMKSIFSNRKSRR